MKNSLLGNEHPLEGINRATGEGFLKYMKANPFYFLFLSGLPASEKNITAYFAQMVKDGFVAAAHLPGDCNKCVRDAIACNDCEVLLRRHETRS